MQKALLILFFFLFNVLASTGELQTETGCNHPLNWKAQWIVPAFEEDTVNRPCPVFRKEFNGDKQLISAMVYVTSHGLYEAKINGKKVGDALLTPGWTDYDKRLQYQSYDVINLLNKGVNTVQVTLASGWYRGTIGWENKHNTYGKTLDLLFQMELTFKDGGQETIASDGSWTCATGTVRNAELYNGETIDARKEPASWKPVRIANYEFNNLVPTGDYDE